jgi:hypothetical protein
MLGFSCRIASTSGGRSVDGGGGGGGGGGMLSLVLGKNLSIVCWTCCPNVKDDGEEDIEEDDSSIVLSLEEGDSWMVLSYTNVQGCKSALLKSFFFTPSPLLS